MTAYLTKKRAAFAAMSIFGIVVLSGGALAITDNVFSYSNPKTGYYGIDHMGMVPDSTAAADNYGMGLGRRPASRHRALLC